MNRRLFILFYVLFLPILFGCDGLRLMRADINLKNENPEYDYKVALQLIDDISKKHNLKCSFSEDEFVRHCRLEFARLSSRVNTKTGTFAIELSEFGPIGATREYQLLHKELSDLIQHTFKKDSITLNPERCWPHFGKGFSLKLHDRRSNILFFVHLSVEPEFSRAIAAFEPVATSNGMKDSGCYEMRDTNRCKRYVGGDYIGVWESVIVDLRGDSRSDTLYVELTDHSCKESELTKLLYEELLKRLKDLFGEGAVTIPKAKK